mmetsp:Transcript_15349/g.28364  ORF Transcript_15349/g.28364 Transcript_15349/m.28364 type:complete len:235 (+) Transcript_15349:248-952(+)
MPLLAAVRGTCSLCSSRFLVLHLHFSDASLLHVGLQSRQAMHQVLGNTACVLEAGLHLTFNLDDGLSVSFGLFHEASELLQIFHLESSLPILLCVFRIQGQGTVDWIELIILIRNFFFYVRLRTIESRIGCLFQVHEETSIAPHIMILEDVCFKFHHFTLHERAVDVAHEAVVLLVIGSFFQICTHGGESIDNDTRDDGCENQDHKQIVHVIKDELEPGKVRLVPYRRRSVTII